MKKQGGGFVGFTCAYTPLALIDAAGFTPYRILPGGESPDRAGAVLHDNICPHVKRVLGRAMAGDLPDLAGLVLMNSCDTMRRLADAWQAVRPEDRLVLVDLPVALDDRAVRYFTCEMVRLMAHLSEWAGRQVTVDDAIRSVARYNELASGLERLDKRAVKGRMAGGRSRLQEVLNRSVTRPIDESMAEVNRLLAEEECSRAPGRRVPVFLFGNVLPDPEVFELLESCGCQVAADDVCTGKRQLLPLRLDGSEDVLGQFARGLLSRQVCARTVEASRPGMLAEQVLAGARDCGAKGVIAHVMKFCDPYLARLAGVRQVMREAGLPLLVLEGDCTLRSLGQHRTRIEAFVEMLEG